MLATCLQVEPLDIEMMGTKITQSEVDMAFRCLPCNCNVIRSQWAPAVSALVHIMDKAIMAPYKPHYIRWYIVIDCLKQITSFLERMVCSTCLASVHAGLPKDMKQLRVSD